VSPTGRRKAVVGFDNSGKTYLEIRSRSGKSRRLIEFLDDGDPLEWARRYKAGGVKERQARMLLQARFSNERLDPVWREVLRILRAPNHNV
jgi:hypothetical protein